MIATAIGTMRRPHARRYNPPTIPSRSVQYRAEQAKTRIVLTQVIGTGHHHKGVGWVKVMVPAWKSKYPVKIWCVPDEVIPSVIAGQSVAIEVEAFKPKKAGKASRAYNWWWRFIGIPAHPTDINDSPFVDLPQAVARARDESAAKARLRWP